jgi:hypothetical protein
MEGFYWIPTLLIIVFTIIIEAANWCIWIGMRRDLGWHNLGSVMMISRDIEFQKHGVQIKVRDLKARKRLWAHIQYSRWRRYKSGLQQSTNYTDHAYIMHKLLSQTSLHPKWEAREWGGWSKPLAVLSNTGQLGPVPILNIPRTILTPISRSDLGNSLHFTSFPSGTTLVVCWGCC